MESDNRNDTTKDLVLMIEKKDYKFNEVLRRFIIEPKYNWDKISCQFNENNINEIKLNSETNGIPELKNLFEILFRHGPTLKKLTLSEIWVLMAKQLNLDECEENFIYSRRINYISMTLRLITTTCNMGILEYLEIGNDWHHAEVDEETLKICANSEGLCSNLKNLKLEGLKISNGYLLGNWLKRCRKLCYLSLSGSIIMNCKGLLFPINIDENSKMLQLHTIEMDHTLLCSCCTCILPLEERTHTHIKPMRWITYSWESEQLNGMPMGGIIRPCLKCSPQEIGDWKLRQKILINKFYDNLLITLPNLKNFQCSNLPFIKNLSNALKRCNRRLSGTVTFKFPYQYQKSTKMCSLREYTYYHFFQNFPSENVIFDSNFERLCERIQNEWTPSIHPPITIQHILRYINDYNDWKKIIPIIKDKWRKYPHVELVNILWINTIYLSNMDGKDLSQAIQEIINCNYSKKFKLYPLLHAIFYAKNKPEYDIFINLLNIIKQNNFIIFYSNDFKKKTESIITEIKLYYDENKNVSTRV